jgi:YebC/PmpR family DNA-binding regulatory protein
MAGHSKFANIQHRKGAQDKRRAMQFTKLAREIQAAVKLGGSDPGSNARLYRAIAAARAESMPKDNIQRAVDRGAGGGQEDYKEVRYEGFGPGGVGVIVECLTDNLNRTAGEVRAAFTKNGGNLGQSNSVTVGFNHVGEIRYPLAAASEDAMMEAALDAGAEDVAVEGEEHVVTCERTALIEVSRALTAKFGDPASAKFVWRAQNDVPIAGDAAATLIKLIGLLEDLDDVQTVYTNLDISDEEMAKLDV